MCSTECSHDGTSANTRCLYYLQHAHYFSACHIGLGLEDAKHAPDDLLADCCELWRGVDAFRVWME